MANSILISTDMNSVYIIDSNDMVIFSNSLSGDGVAISLDSKDELQGAAAQITFPGTPVIKTITGAQWTLTYNSATQNLYIIGITDQTMGLTEGGTFNLGGATAVQIKRSGSFLLLIES